MPPDFQIKAAGPVSSAFLHRNIFTFAEATAYIRHLPYRRNADKINLLTVFTDDGGTCSTKHALLKKLADENGCEGFALTVGLFKMNKVNTPAVADTLGAHGLDHIPEAHCYLVFNNQILDFTNADSKPSDFESDLLEQKTIAPEQITDFKVAFHKTYLNKWLIENKDIAFNMEEIWAIREQCIRDLQTWDEERKNKISAKNE